MKIKFRNSINTPSIKTNMTQNDQTIELGMSLKVWFELLFMFHYSSLFRTAGAFKQGSMRQDDIILIKSLQFILN